MMSRFMSYVLALMVPCAVMGKSVEMWPLRVSARTSALSVEGKMSSMVPLTVENSRSPCQSERPIVALMEPLTVEALTSPADETWTPPLTV